MTEQDIIQVITRLRKLEQKGREVKCEIDGIRGLLRDEFQKRGTNEVQAGRYVVKQINYTRQQFDTARFREEKPKIYQVYCNPQTISRIEVAG